ncbi:hypothetical protein PFISCL1PPCAC_720, partial [Pristionchus fissidentatus]
SSRRAVAMKNEKLFMFLTYPLIIIVAAVVILFVSTPVVLYSFPQITSFIIEFNFMATPQSNAGMMAKLGREFYLTSGSTTISVWHITPDEAQLSTKKDYVNLLNDTNYRILVYFPSQERDMEKFASFCRVLKAWNNVQIISFDYKGSGKSAGDTTQYGAIEDALTVYHWIRKQTPNNAIHFWAHSLGAGIASATLKQLVAEGYEVKSIVLEAPIYDTLTLMQSYWLYKMYAFLLPKNFISKSLDIVDINYSTTKSISTVDVPTLVLHGEHDDVVTVENSRRLVREARKKRDFIFIVEWRCKRVTHWPGQQAGRDEIKNLVESVEYLKKITIVSVVLNK